MMTTVLFIIDSMTNILRRVYESWGISMPLRHLHPLVAVSASYQTAVGLDNGTLAQP